MTEEYVRPPVAPRGEELRQEWWRHLVTPGWKIALYTVLVLGAGLSGWQLVWRPWIERTEIATAEGEINRAYRGQRTLKARITGFSYARFPETLGEKHDKEDEADYVALDRAKRILLDAVSERPGAATRHALGRCYLAEKSFDEAERLFISALQAEPDNARIHSDLGATLFEKWGLLQSDTAIREELRRRSLEHLTKALAFDGSLLEARFNLALLYQYSDQAQRAREEWQKYLALDPGTPWRKEAEFYFGKLK
jgi:tetratricopeptide (TPR) repeat protein